MTNRRGYLPNMLRKSINKSGVCHKTYPFLLGKLANNTLHIYSKRYNTNKMMKICFKHIFKEKEDSDDRILRSIKINDLMKG